MSQLSQRYSHPSQQTVRMLEPICAAQIKATVLSSLIEEQESSLGTCQQVSSTPWPCESVAPADTVDNSIIPFFSNTQNISLCPIK